MLLTQCRSELDDLQKKVSDEKDKYQQAAHSKTSVSAVPLFPVSDKFVLNKDDASYTLSLELQSPIDNILLQVCLMSLLELLLSVVSDCPG